MYWEFFFFSSRRRHTRCLSDWSSDVCSSDLSSISRTGRPIRAGTSPCAPPSAASRCATSGCTGCSEASVKKWTTLDQALTPDGKTISLHEQDGSYAIRVDGIPLMPPRQHASEEKLAQLACAHLRGMRHARVLIGGLGFGFTLQAALGAVPAGATVVMAEI